MVVYKIVFSKRADKDKALLKAAGLEDKTRELLAIISNNPFQSPPPYEVLKGRLQGIYSRRINYQHRLVYIVHKEEMLVHILRMWSHYDLL
ncbi:MAG: Txe/YoeB family addiction module toxin [Bacillota bacterium]|nr:Txe/YoeB family addiction module toxin [Bacillota bacterium]